ncbi:MAG: hypothetical protein ACFFDN_07860 [Candidatus Hodarchaeota archaeon]
MLRLDENPLLKEEEKIYRQRTFETVEYCNKKVEMLVKKLETLQS